MAELLLYCRLPDGSVAAVEVAADATVAELRKAAAAVCGADGCVRVSVGGAELRDGGAALADVGLSMQQTVDVARAGLSGKVLSCGSGHTLAVLDDGSVAAWGCIGGGRCDVPDFGGQRAVGVAAGHARSFALLEDGTIAAWGCERPLPHSLQGKRAVGIAAGGFWSATGDGLNIAAFDDGAVVLWGAFDHELRADTAACAVACGLTFGAIVCGSTVRWLGREGVTETEVDGVRGVGTAHASLLLVLADGQVREVGHFGTVRTARSELAVRPLPFLEAGPRVVAACGGVTFDVLLREDGSVQARRTDGGVWSVPKAAFGGERAVAVSAGAYFGCVGLESGRVVAWGQGDHGQTTVPDFGGRGLMRPSV